MERLVAILLTAFSSALGMIPLVDWRGRGQRNSATPGDRGFGRTVYLDGIDPVGFARAVFPVWSLSGCQFSATNDSQKLPSR